MSTFPSLNGIQVIKALRRLGFEVIRIKNTRPCVVISPDEMNHHIGTVIVAPMTSRERGYPSRVNCTFQKVNGQVVLDQIRTVDKLRLVKRLGALSPAVADQMLAVLTEMFQK